MIMNGDRGPVPKGGSGWTRRLRMRALVCVQRSKHEPARGQLAGSSHVDEGRIPRNWLPAKPF